MKAFHYLCTAYKDKAAEAAAEGNSNTYISRPQVNYTPPAPDKEAVDSVDDIQPNPAYQAKSAYQPNSAFAANTPYFFPVNPKPQPNPVYPRTDQYGVSPQGTPGEETEL